MLWVTLIAGQGEMIERVITVPVEYTATSDELVMTGDKANEAKLHLSGSKSDLNAMSTNAMGVKIDLSKMAAGRQTVFISEENIHLPRDVRLLDVQPASIEVNLAGLKKSVLIISPQLVGMLPQGLALESVSVAPESLPVLIPSGEAGTAYKQITTTPIYLDNIRASTILYCKVVAPQAVQPLDKRWPDVEVSIQLRQQPESTK